MRTNYLVACCLGHHLYLQHPSHLHQSKLQLQLPLHLLHHLHQLRRPCLLLRLAAFLLLRRLHHLHHQRPLLLEIEVHSYKQFKWASRLKRR